MNGKEIKKKRKALGLTCADLAEKLGVSERTVEGWEQGRKQSGTAQHFLRKVLNDVEQRPTFA